MEDEFDEMENLMDDDPALDYILYDEMSRGENARRSRQGCFGLLLLVLLPAAALLSFFTL